MSLWPDYVLKREETLLRLEEYLDIPLARIPMRRAALDQWRHDDGVNYFDFFAPATDAHGHEHSAGENQPCPKN